MSKTVSQPKTQNQPKLIFGYGSLMNIESLKTTVPDAFDLRPSYVKGFRRDFSHWDPKGFTETNLDLAGIPHCALDVKPIAGSTARVNGVAFKMSELHFARLLAREQNYMLLQTTSYDFFTNKPIGDCWLFSAGKSTGTFEFHSESQLRYLQMCLQGAKHYGQQFYQEFLTTTFIQNKPLSKIPELASFVS